MFVDIGQGGQVVGVDVILSGKQGSLEVPTGFPTPVGRVFNGVHLLMPSR